MSPEHLEQHSAHTTHTAHTRTGQITRPGGADGSAPAGLRLFARLLNPLMGTFAGRRGVTFFGVVNHRGRRSGRWYATPVAARMTADGFVVPMSFGPEADWVKNVLASGGCTIRSNGVDYVEMEPEVIDRADARLAFRPVERTLLKLMGIDHFVRLRHRREPISMGDSARVPEP